MAFRLMGARRRGCSSRLAHQTEEGARRCMHAQTHSDWFQPYSSHARRHPAHRRATGEMRGLRRVRRLPDAGFGCAHVRPLVSFRPFPLKFRLVSGVSIFRSAVSMMWSTIIYRWPSAGFLVRLFFVFVAPCSGVWLLLGAARARAWARCTLSMRTTSYRQTRTRGGGGCTMARYAARSRQRFRARARARTHRDYELRAPAQRTMHNAQ